MTAQSEFSEILNDSRKISDNAYIYEMAESAYKKGNYEMLGLAISALIDFEKKFRSNLED